MTTGVVIKENAIVRDSIIMNDTIIGEGSIIDRCILDKEVIVEAGSRLGYGDDFSPNWLEPNRLNTGITLVGKRAHLPANITVGRNSRIGVGVQPDEFTSLDVPSGDSVDSTLAAVV
jgi:glucose-1-phosphate adenylyltransferase